MNEDTMESNPEGSYVFYNDYLHLLDAYKSLQKWQQEANSETLEFDNGDLFAGMTLPERIRYMTESHSTLRLVAEENKREAEATRIENARLKNELSDVSEPYYIADNVTANIFKENAALKIQNESLSKQLNAANIIIGDLMAENRRLEKK